VARLNVIDLLGPLGLLLIAAAQIIAAMGRTLPGRPVYYLAAGGALIVLHVILRFEAIRSALGRRQVKYGGNSIVMVLAVLAILVGANYFVARHSKRWDLTKNQRFGLSDQSRKVLGGLKDDVRFIYFANERDAAATKEAQDRLHEYDAASPKVKVEYADALKDPARAREFDLKAVPTLVVQQGARTEKVQSGEGEHSLDEMQPGGFSALRAALEKNQYESEQVSLLRESHVPERCSVLVIGGPQQDLEDPVVDGIADFVAHGGKALVMIEPELRTAFPKLAALLARWGIETARDTVVEVYARLTAEGIAVTPDERIVIQQYPLHEITRDFLFPVRLQTARSVTPAATAPPGTRVEPLLQSSQGSWAESDFKSLGNPSLDEKTDKKGPITLAATARIDVAQPSPSPAAPAGGEEPRKKDGRVAVFGDSDFATNAGLGADGNSDFTLNTIAWLSEDTDLISIRPRDPDDQRLFLTDNQGRLIYGTALVLLPGLCLLAGIWTWWRRRS
jgi:ABC-type uncharacterized transport system involved in gliding motility auxiliary subunit